jgi:hypothetical protein
MRIELIKQLEPLIKEKARENQATSTGGANPQLLSNCTKAEAKINTREELAKLAGVSQGTIRRANVIIKEGTDEQKEKLRSGSVTINKVFRELRPKKEKIKRSV